MTELFYSPIAHISTEELLSLDVPRGLLAGSEKYTDLRHRGQSVAVRMLLFRALEQLGVDPDGVLLCFTEEGKPTLLGTPLYVSLTHSDSYVGVALGDAPVGVDVEDEIAVRHPHQLAKRFLDSDTEKIVRSAENPHLAFAFAFTRLEAVVKQKEGVTLPFAKEHLSPIYYRRGLPLPDGKQAAFTAVGDPPFRARNISLTEK